MNQGRFVGGFLLASLLTVASLMAMPLGAGAATTIGSDLAASPTEGSACFRRCTYGQWALPTTSQAPGGLLAPYDGVVVRWRVKIGIETLESALVITRPGNSDIRDAVGASPGVIAPTDQISTYEVRLPIHTGDALALACCGSTGFFHQYVRAGTPGAVLLTWSLPFELGSGHPGYAEQDEELLVNADIERDCDGDGLGDETQDNDVDPSACICKGKQATIIGTPDNDVRDGTPGPDVMAGQGGNDTLSGVDGDDTICGGAGNDTLLGQKGKDKLVGEAGKDTLKGGPGKDKLNAGAGKDKLIGQGGKDTCKGGKGKDTGSQCEVRKSL